MFLSLSAAVAVAAAQAPQSAAGECPPTAAAARALVRRLPVIRRNEAIADYLGQSEIAYEPGNMRILGRPLMAVEHNLSPEQLAGRAPFDDRFEEIRFQFDPRTGESDQPRYSAGLVRDFRRRFPRAQDDGYDYWQDEVAGPVDWDNPAASHRPGSLIMVELKNSDVELRYRCVYVPQ